MAENFLFTNNLCSYNPLLTHQKIDILLNICFHCIADMWLYNNNSISCTPTIVCQSFSLTRMLKIHYIGSPFSRVNNCSGTTVDRSRPAGPYTHRISGNSEVPVWQTMPRSTQIRCRFEKVSVRDGKSIENIIILIYSAYTSNKHVCNV
jgi:hypothetical protein